MEVEGDLSHFHLVRQSVVSWRGSTCGMNAGSMLLLLLQVVSFSLICLMIRRLSSFLLLLAFLGFCCLLRSGTHLFTPSEPHVYLRLVVGSSLVVVASSLLPFDICYRSGLCTHLFLLSELSVRLYPAVGSSSIVIPLFLLPFLDICYRSGLCTHLFLLSELSVRLYPAVGSSSIVIPLFLLPFLDICYRSGLCTHLFLLSELSVRLHPAVGSSFVIFCRRSSMFTCLMDKDMCLCSCTFKLKNVDFLTETFISQFTR